MKTLPLREIAHARSGDKGDTSNLGVIAYDEADYPILRDQVTADRVAALYGDLVRGEVTRYELPNIGALNFVDFIPLSFTSSEDMDLRQTGRTAIVSQSGGLMGSLFTDQTAPPGRLRRAMAYGTVIASLTVEGFGGRASGCYAVAVQIKHV